MVNNSSTNNSKDEDYGNTSNNAASKIQGPTYSQKRAKRAKDTEHNKVETSPTYSLDVSNQAITATSSGNIQQSNEIPIYKYLILKNINSKVMYCLTFSQDLLADSCETLQRQGVSRSPSSNSDKRNLEQLLI